jgi:hypothetical protein
MKPRSNDSIFKKLKLLVLSLQSSLRSIFSLREAIVTSQTTPSIQMALLAIDRLSSLTGDRIRDWQTATSWFSLAMAWSLAKNIHIDFTKNFSCH